ncbi:hypothetical protein JCM14469_16360 [Desulfatiferula olefinivorans]
MKRFIFCMMFVFSVCVTSIPALCLEILSNESLAGISGQAVSDNPAFDVLPEVPLPSIIIKQELRAFSQNNAELNNTVAVDFIGYDAVDPFGNTYRENFSATVEAENVVYQNKFEGNDGPYGDYRDHLLKDTYSFAVFEGVLTGMAVVPEYYDNDPALRHKTLTISRSRIDLPDGLTGNYLCSYQGNLFSHDDISDQDQSFLIYPNRQTITTGRAEDGNLAVLVPSGEDGHTVWKPLIKHRDPETGRVEYMVVPEGETYIHISLNQMITRTDLRFKVRLGHGPTPWKANDDDHLPADMGQTLGSFCMTGGSMAVSGGSVLITTNDTL